MTSSLIIAFISLSSTRANVTLPSLVSSDMVLQQNEEIRLWGWGEPLEEIEIRLGWNGEVVKTVADSHANWSVQVRTPGAGGPYEIKIAGYNEILLENVMIGEIWVCSGQSNMQWPMSGGINRGEEEIARANAPDIRLFNVTRKTAMSEQIELQGKWEVCQPETVGSFSAVGYSFAKQVHAVLKVPVGIINSSWGGTPAEAWMPSEVFQKQDSLRQASALLEPKPWGPQEPSLAFNAMISPLTQMKIAGALWYQGEANTINPEYYEYVLSAMINSWRELWKKKFPFYFVQIAPFAYGKTEEGVLVRDAQRRVNQKVSNTGMVVISDIGDVKDIHPKEKLEVGIRLARLALKSHYKHLNELVESPELSATVTEKNKIYLKFDHAEGLHFSPDDESLFELAGRDGIFFPAKAQIRNEQVVLSSREVKDPVYVRFSWGNTSVSNLFNSAGLPASSFSTYRP